MPVKERTKIKENKYIILLFSWMFFNDSLKTKKMIKNMFSTYYGISVFEHNLYDKRTSRDNIAKKITNMITKSTLGC